MERGLFHIALNCRNDRMRRDAPQRWYGASLALWVLNSTSIPCVAERTAQNRVSTDGHHAGRCPTRTAVPFATSPRGPSAYVLLCDRSPLWRSSDLLVPLAVRCDLAFLSLWNCAAS